MNERVIQSVGIDIGTTTTQLVFSLLRLRNLAGMTQVQRYVITAREIVYESPVAFTPLEARGRLDAGRLGQMIRHWYADAGKSVADIESGAVIITGESLKASNARDVVMDMVAGLGDFVVASAGPHLESVLAGRGAGASARSLASPGYHLNIDIGGGTSNYAVFERGRVVDTACLNVGGRLIETGLDGQILHVSAPARLIGQETAGARGFQGTDLPAVAARMADMICKVMLHSPDALLQHLLQTPPLRKAYTFASVSISGGVGACWAAPGGNPYRFGDMGPLLAEALRSRFASLSVRPEPSAHSLRATVIGAGAWSLTLSGATVWTQDYLLPLRNLPVALVSVDWKARGELVQAISDSVNRLDLDAGCHFVLAFPSGSAVDYATVQWLARNIDGFYAKAFAGSEDRPILVSVEDDMGKALGMELRSLTARSLLIIDEVRLEEGDYLDIARPLYAQGVVPLTIKSLAFPVAARAGVF